MAKIQCLPGNQRTRHWGSAYKDLVWVVGISDDFSLPFKEQASRAYANVDRLLAEAGTDRTQILTVNVILTDLNEKAVFDEMWADWVGDDPQCWPQRSLHRADLAPGVLLEILTLAVRETRNS